MFPFTSDIMSKFIRKYLFLNSDIPDANRPKHTDYFNQVIVVGRLGSVLPFDNPGFLMKLLYRIFMALTDLFTISTSFQLLYCCVYQFDGDILKIIDILINIAVYGFGSFFVVYYQYRSDFLKMMFRFAYENFRYRSARGLTVFTAASAIRYNKAFLPIFVVSIFFASYQWVAAATISTLVKKQRQLPLDIHFPVDHHATPYFELLFTIQLYIHTVLGFHYANISCLFFTFSNLVTAQLDILRCSIKNTGHTALLRLGVPHAALSRTPGFKSSVDSYYCGSEEELDCSYDQLANKEIYLGRIGQNYKTYTCSNKHFKVFEYMGNVDIYQDLNKEAVEEKVIEAIKDCVEHHKAIRTFCMYMEDFFYVPFGVNLIGLCTTIGFSLYSTADHFEMKIMCYLTMAVVMTLIICYLGNQIRLQSELLDLAVYWSGWEHQSARVRKYYLILMQQSARPVLLTGGGLVRLTLDSFIAIMKMAFSFFTLMRNAMQDHHY